MDEQEKSQAFSLGYKDGEVTAKLRRSLLTRQHVYDP
jgi:hypothetical protein